MPTPTPRNAWLAALLAAAAACSSSSPAPQPPAGFSLNVGSVFPAGTALRDAYSGATATVAADGTVALTPDPGGVVLLERVGAAASPSQWKGGIVYFVLTDRFENGDPSNDASYGRTPGGPSEPGAWHGGDLAGLTQKLDYIASLGTTAIWISPVVEQVRGWVGGGSGDFRHWGYHGYWALDFTRLDANLGTDAELRALVDGAHQRGMRVILDVVMNHPGYGTGDDLVRYLPEVIDEACLASFTPPAGRGWQAWNDCVNYSSTGWSNWWGVSWVRAGFPLHTTCGGTGNPVCTDLNRQQASLPDFITEATGAVDLPPLFARKAAAGDATGVAALPGSPTVRDYLVKWHADWVRAYGFDGFRCDTAKHVELAAWKALKDAGTAALAEWKAANPTKKIDDAGFWMVGEVFPHGVLQDAYYSDGGFDALLNFDAQPALASLLQVSGDLASGATALEALYAGMAGQLNGSAPFDVLSYLSSHDTKLFFDLMGSDVALQRQAGTALLLLPGGVQVFYGDESGRRPGPTVSDALQATRSDMNWATGDASLLAHWQKVGTFRRSHAAVGAGTHQRLAAPDGTYAFARRLGGAAPDDVVVALLRPGTP